MSLLCYLGRHSPSVHSISRGKHAVMRRCVRLAPSRSSALIKGPGAQLCPWLGTLLTRPSAHSRFSHIFCADDAPRVAAFSRVRDAVSSEIQYAGWSLQRRSTAVR